MLGFIAMTLPSKVIHPEDEKEIELLKQKTSALAVRLDSALCSSLNYNDPL